MSSDQADKKPCDLRETLERVFDERSFVEFLNALARDWSEVLSLDAVNQPVSHSSGASRWENGSIGAFFDAAATWAEASKNGLRFYNVPSNPWRRAADVLIAGKEYE
ncbi:hypothetical protein B2G74_00145 [Burkholderia sp. A27]|nr:hypothetical protein B2G74_00145 [Burkholderia sp. A27]